MRKTFLPIVVIKTDKAPIATVNGMSDKPIYVISVGVNSLRFVSDRKLKNGIRIIPNPRT
jgi:hypothetical protein